MARTIVVGLGEVAVTRDPFDVLTANGLGASVAVCAFDPLKLVAGIAVVALPTGDVGDAERGRFADGAVPMLIARMTELDADVARIQAALVGAADMPTLGAGDARIDLGARNVAAILRLLDQCGVAVAAKDVGGCLGRCARMSTTGVVTVKTIGAGEHELVTLAKAGARAAAA